MGGVGNPFNTKIRDLGIPFLMVTYFLSNGLYGFWLPLCFILMFGAQTTYFKDKGEDAKWFNWLFVGLAFSFCMSPFVLVFGTWKGFGIRSIIVTGFTLGWSQLIGNADLEESGRGLVQIITLPLLFID